MTEVSDMPEQPQLKELNQKKKFQVRRKFKYFRTERGENGQPVKKYIPFVKTIEKTSLMGKVCPLHSGTSKDRPETWRIVNETSKI